jgi:hypothetical protein
MTDRAREKINRGGCLLTFVKTVIRAGGAPTSFLPIVYAAYASAVFLLQVLLASPEMRVAYGRPYPGA